jgi:hypothetical protein
MRNMRLADRIALAAKRFRVMQSNRRMTTVVLVMAGNARFGRALPGCRELPHRHFVPTIVGENLATVEPITGASPHGPLN